MKSDTACDPSDALVAFRKAGVEFNTLPLSALRESPTNPRRHMDQAALKELTESIRAQGVLVPLLVRPTDEVGVQKGGHDGRLFEVVCGSRRHAAAKAAGLEEVPVRICDFTAEQAMEIQIIENLQRQDVHPLDEAEGYARLMKSGRYDATALAAKVGRSESYIHRRVKLCALIDPAQKAFWADKINAGHAELMARLQSADQKKVLEFATTRANCTAAVLEHWIAENVLLRLREAPFDKKDATLSIQPGGCACVVCHKRTSAAPLLFPEVGKDDRCTDPACWQAKVEAHVKRLLEQGDGDAKRLRLSEEYSYGQVKESGVVPGGKWREIGPKGPRCEHARQGVIVKGHRRGQALTVCIEPKCKVHHSSGGYQRSPADLAAEKKRKLQGRIDAEIRGRLRAAIAEAAGDRMTAAHVHLWGYSIAACLSWDAAQSLCKRYGLEPVKMKWGGSDHNAALAKRLDQLQPEGLPHAVTEMAVAAIGDEELVRVAPEWDVEPAAIRKAVTAELTPKAKTKGKGKPARPKARAEKACVECGCTQGKACIDERSGTPCSWVPAADLPQGVKGPLCSACLAAAKRKKRDPKKPKPGTKAGGKGKER